MINALKTPAVIRTETNADLTYARLRRAAIKHFLAQGWAANSALLWGTLWANRKVAQLKAQAAR